MGPVTRGNELTQLSVCIGKEMGGRFAFCTLFCLLREVTGSAFMFIRGDVRVARFLGKEGDPPLLYAWGDVVRSAVFMTRCCGPLCFYGENVKPALWGENAIRFCCVHGETWSALLFPRGESAIHFAVSICGLVCCFHDELL